MSPPRKGLEATTLRLLAELGLEPSWLLPSLEGGVCIAFARNGRYAEIQLLNRGEIITTCSSESTGSLSESLQPSAQKPMIL